eukprot:gene17335-17854_t
MGCYAGGDGILHTLSDVGECSSKCADFRFWAMQCPRGGKFDCVCFRTMPNTKKLEDTECQGGPWNQHDSALGLTTDQGRCDGVPEVWGGDTGSFATAPYFNRYYKAGIDMQTCERHCTDTPGCIGYTHPGRNNGISWQAGSGDLACHTEHKPCNTNPDTFATGDGDKSAALGGDDQAEDGDGNEMHFCEATGCMMNTNAPGGTPKMHNVDGVYTREYTAAQSGTGKAVYKKTVGGTDVGR